MFLTSRRYGHDNQSWRRHESTSQSQPRWSRGRRAGTQEGGRRQARLRRHVRLYRLRSAIPVASGPRGYRRGTPNRLLGRGTIDGDEADESNFSVLVTAISSDELRWHNGLATGLSADSCALGKRVAKDLLPTLSTDTIGLFVFPDGLTYDIDNFFAGLEGDLPSERFLPLWGGGAGNDLNLGKPTYQYCDDEVISDGVSYVLLSGEAQTAWAISHSVIPIGGERIVTRSKGNVIYEIDGKPATDVFKEYLPEDALADERDWVRYSISLALSFKAPSYMKDEEYVVRGVPQPNLTDGAIIVQSDVEEGTSIWFS